MCYVKRHNFATILGSNINTIKYYFVFKKYGDEEDTGTMNTAFFRTDEYKTIKAGI